MVNEKKIQAAVCKTLMNPPVGQTQRQTSACVFWSVKVATQHAAKLGWYYLRFVVPL